MTQNSKNQDTTPQKALDDERRVKVLSPSTLVAKRFFRNRLAMIGLFILLFMFLFSFLGGFISPYGESEVFEGYEEMVQDYAGITKSKDYRFIQYQSDIFPTNAQNQFLMALGKQADSFTANDTEYTILTEGEGFYSIATAKVLAKATILQGNYKYSFSDEELSQDVLNAFQTAFEANETSFEVNGVSYSIDGSRREATLSAVEPMIIATQKVVEQASDKELDFDFQLAMLQAQEKQETSFIYDGETYQLNIEKNTATVLSGNTEIAIISDYIIQAISSGDVIEPELKAMALDAIDENVTTFVYTSSTGEEEEYTIERKNEQYTLRRENLTKIIKVYEAPSKEHWLGTDSNGMDILTRLMYGGRISLMIGFVVILIQTVIGVVLGGVAGYFGRWVDNLIMRVVDIFNCIPTWPILIIIGAIMDAQRIDPKARIYMMMLVLGVLGWPSVARLVRGQILSLREQEFMIATEATGISIGRRIFKHLIPNVIPQLIVICTMGLGGVILTESTMSFLGLGVKFPFASWGNIIQSVSNVYVMTNYWFIWIPAGFLILITVLGFNFVGDGLRDAFDPKMKR